MAVIFALTVYAIFTKSDFTTCGAISIVIGVAILVGTIIGIFVQNDWYHIGLSILSTIGYGAYIVMDIQLVIGTNKYEYAVDDYIIASATVYMDMMNMFLEILKIVATVSTER